MAIIRDVYELDPYANAVYLFCGRDSRKLKALHFDKDGFVLLQKRLDGSGRFQWPRECFGSQAPDTSGIPLAYGKKAFLSISQKRSKAVGKRRIFNILCKTENLKILYFQFQKGALTVIHSLTFFVQVSCG
ncbi:MAG: IS66 family insertion sequence element accessory protein TnpB [Enterocloster sp.]